MSVAYGGLGNILYQSHCTTVGGVQAAGMFYQPSGVQNIAYQYNAAITNTPTINRKLLLLENV